MNKTKNNRPKYYLNDKDEFVIENYQLAKPFASFFPGIAGPYGIPMWVFYVNRGQAIVSCGIKDKDHSIMEFYPANKAWQMVPTVGFRTFLKIRDKAKSIFYEPFHNGASSLGFSLQNKMCITSGSLKISEDNLTLGVSAEVEYFTIPNDSYAALVRILTIKNTSNKTRSIQLLDGLPQIIPFGTTNVFLKELSRTIEAWMAVENLDKNAPFYKLPVDPSDRPEVVHVKEGNFYLSFHGNDSKTQLVKPIVDPKAIFGETGALSYPSVFMEKNKFVYPKEQLTKNKIPCGFSLLDIKLPQHEEKTLFSLIGHSRDTQTLNSSLKRISVPDYISKKRKENQRLIEGLQLDIKTQSSSREFDLYVKQTYLDNIIRGGYPVVLKNNDKKSIFYIYARKHGDLERDYNKFQLAPTYLSQGNGNYRDANQNRRSDIWFNPQIKEENLVNFFNLIQTDGFNPLVVKGTSFQLADRNSLIDALKDKIEKDSLDKIILFLEKSFSPGELIFFIEENKIKLMVSFDEFLKIVLSFCQARQEVEHGEGFWTDHWTYNLDLLENYLLVYPEEFDNILFKKRIYSFFDNTEIVRPRNEKYLLREGKPRQLHSTVADTAKKELIKRRTVNPHVVRTEHGQGDIYQTTLINKLLCLFVNKLASLDPKGVGVEMEANKPNWFDSLNGLPALFGSSVCETFELKRLGLFIRDSLIRVKIEKINITEETKDFLITLGILLREYFTIDSKDKDYIFWDKSYSLKESYRHKTKLGLSGNELETNSSEILSILDDSIKKLDIGINKAKVPKSDIYYSYFINKVTEYKKISEHFIKPLEFKQRSLPLFLEAEVHAIKLMNDKNKAKAIYDSTKKSPLYDKKLKMYKVTAPLFDMPEEIGRCRIFTPGWLENESIWLHMEYKYLLEILKSGLYEKFYYELKNTFIPFQNPFRYGRSILENSSFIVSSTFPDKNLHGNGFVARLSGSTAELLSIWLIMNAGKEPFFLDEKKNLYLKFRPILAGWLFDKKGKYSFNFLSKIKVTYHNPKRKNTFGKTGVSIKKISFKDASGKLIDINSDLIPHPYADQIRSRQIEEIDIYF